MKLYKIRRKSDGLYSNGGQYIYFTPKGKTWNSIGAVSSHLAGAYSVCLIRRNGKIIGVDFSKLPVDYDYKDCEIVEAEVEFKPKKDVDNFVDTRYNCNIKPEKAIQ